MKNMIWLFHINKGQVVSVSVTAGFLRAWYFAPFIKTGSVYGGDLVESDCIYI